MSSPGLSRNDSITIDLDAYVSQRAMCARTFTQRFDGFGIATTQRRHRERYAPCDFTRTLPSNLGPNDRMGKLSSGFGLRQHDLISIWVLYDRNIGIVGPIETPALRYCWIWASISSTTKVMEDFQRVSHRRSTAPIPLLRNRIRPHVHRALIGSSAEYLAIPSSAPDRSLQPRLRHLSQPSAFP
jgi:hypothetical protein